MVQKKLQRVTSHFMQDLYKGMEGKKWAGDGLLFIRRLGERSSRVFGSGEPFQLDQLHIGIIVSGEQDVTVNLRQHHLAKGSLLVATPESIMQENGRTEDFNMQVVHMSDALLHRLFGDQVPWFLAHRMSDVSVTPNEPAFMLLLTMLDGLWQSVRLAESDSTDFTAFRDHILKAILSLLVSLSQHDRRQRESHQPRNVIVFNRFLSLVAEHCDRQRTLDFYANRLCLSKQYLGSIIVDVSLRTAREWIDEAALQRIKVMLQHSSMPLGVISERMSFAEPSHLCRYFKRLTGITPGEYRQGRSAKNVTEIAINETGKFGQKCVPSPPIKM